MAISITGIITILIVVYIIFKKIKVEKIIISLFAFNLFYEGFTNIGYFVKFDLILFKVPDLLQFLIAIFSLVYFLKHKRISKFVVFFVLSILISVISINLFPYEHLVRTFDSLDYYNNLEYMHYVSIDIQVIKTSLRLIVFIWNAWAIASIITSLEWEKINEKYIKIGIIVIIISWGEFILKNLFGLFIFSDFINYIFGSDLKTITELTRNGFFVVSGFNNEPSQFTMMLYSYLLIYIISNHTMKRNKYYNFTALSSIVLMLLSSSFRVVAIIPVLLIVLLVKEGRYRTITIAIAASALIAVVMIYTGFADYFLFRLGRTFQFLQTLDPQGISGGEATRLNTIVEAMQAFKSRILFGLGPGTTWAYGFIPSMLVMTGIAGTFLWYKVLFNEIGHLSFNKLNKSLFIICLISVSWIFTDSIGIGYSIYVLAIALSFKYEKKHYLVE